MQTKEELELLTKAVLVDIAHQLGVTPPANAKKADLVDLVFETQQPTQPEQDAIEGVTEEGEEVALTADVVVPYVAGVLDAEVTEDGVDEDGETLYSVADVAGEEIVRGRLIDIMAYAQGIEGQRTLQEGATKAVDTVVKDVPAITNIPAGSRELSDSLAVLEPYGLRYTVDKTDKVVRMQCGAKVATVTLQQPLANLMKQARLFCGA